MLLYKPAKSEINTLKSKGDMKYKDYLNLDTLDRKSILMQNVKEINSNTKNSIIALIL
jgi:hypothetical protein